MCDTFVIISGGTVLFGKNSDREPGEAQLVVRLPEARDDRSRKLRATYIETNQTANRHGVILSKPFWMWGAEMGANDRGVVIGNEAVFTRVIDKTPGLTGMDLLRIGLERGDTAEHALHVITELLENHGQGGVCGYRDKRFRYDNSFIIADPDAAFVLETAGRHWAARRVNGYAAISNCLTIGTDMGLKSTGLEDFAREKGLWSGKGDFSFKTVFDTRLLPYFGASHTRVESSLCRLDALRQKKRAALQDAAAILRTHQKPDDAAPAGGSNADLCMHAAGPLIRRSQTCGSMISRLEKDRFLHFLTGTSAPCLSIFKPVAFGTDDFYVLNPDERTMEGSLWHRFESVHRRAIFSAEERQAIRESRQEAEMQMFSLLEESNGEALEKQLIAADRTAADWSEHWIEKMKGERFEYPFSPYGLFWRRMNRMDGVE